MYVIFSCFVENNLIIACRNQIKGISLYQQKNKTNIKTKAMNATESRKAENNSLVKVYNTTIRMWQYQTPEGRAIITCKTEKGLDKQFQLHIQTTEK